MRNSNHGVPTFPQGLHATVIHHAQVGGFHFNELIQTHELGWHRHDDFSLALILDGAGKSATRSDDVAYRKGHAVFEPSDVPQSECGALRYLNIHFPLSALPEDGGVFSRPDAVRCFRNGAVVYLMRRIYAELALGDSASKLALHGLTYEALAELTREKPFRVESRSPHWIKTTEEYLQAHFTQPICLSALAAQVMRHPAHLSRSFRRFTGCTLGDYVRKLRAAYAVELLTETDLPLATIAIQAGFYDQADLTRAVRRHTGTTPARHRKLPR